MSDFQQALSNIIPNRQDDGVRVAIPAYRYLSEKALIIPDAEERFLEGVNDIYHLIQEDHFERYSEFLIPSPRLVADTIDNENNNIISLFYDRDQEMKDNVRTLYMTEITPTLSYHVIDALEQLSLPYRDNSKDIGYIGERMPCKFKTFYDPYQIKMFGDELYDRK